MWNSLKVLVEREIDGLKGGQPSLWESFVACTKVALPIPADHTATYLKALSQVYSGTGQGIAVASGTTAASTADTNTPVIYLEQFMKDFGITPKGEIQLPDKNPLTMTTIDWAQEISKDNLESLRRQTIREAKAPTKSKTDPLDRISALISLCLKTGNISLAMLLFSHLEARSANQLTKTLMEKVQELQANKRKLADQIATQKSDEQGGKNIQKLRNQMEDNTDDINVLQTFIRDVAQNKQESMELANAFLNAEHQTTMDIVRSFGH